MLDREVEETGDVVWTPPPPEGMAVHFDVVYTPAGVNVVGHPGADTELVGTVDLENGERVFVTYAVRPIEQALRDNIDNVRAARVLDAEGNPIRQSGMLAFGQEPNPDADDGTFVGVMVDVTRPDE